MDRSGTEELDLEVAGPTPPPAPRPMRRCVQAKLPWAMGRGGGGGGGAAAEAGRGGEDSEESDGGRKGKGKTKARSQARTPRKTPTSCKSSRGLNKQGKKCAVSDSQSPQDRQNDDEYNVFAPKPGNPKCCKALKFRGSKTMQNGATTPPKIADSNATNYLEPQLKGNLHSDGFDSFKQNMQQPVVDLWLESKASAEENLRLSAGKQTHPFFNSFKTAKKVQKATDAFTAGNWHQGEYMEGFLFHPLIHVFDKLGDEFVSLDWEKWSFTDRPQFDEIRYSIDADTYRSVGPLKLDSLCSKADNERNKSVVPGFNSVVDLDHGQNCDSVEERFKTYYSRCSYWPKNSLWTNRYQPQCAQEVCGNESSVCFLNEWLKNWHGFPRKKNSSCISSSIGESQDSFCESGSEMDDTDERAMLKNVLLIIGPVGCGKSAAIYACAKEQGFEVIEVNASDLRNGAHMRQRFSEGLESHGLNRWSTDDPTVTRNDVFTASSPDVIEIVDLETGCIENSKMSKKEGSPGDPGNHMVGRGISSQVERKSLILFEEVDIEFEEDRGFIASIIHLAETTKRPIILTSNNRSRILSRFMDCPILDFTVPSSAELLSHLKKVCTAEKICISSSLLERLISFCLGDIRTTMMLLQFWCQGSGGLKERMLSCSYSPIQLDIYAAHLILPRLLQWECRCQLSEKVVEEINRSVSLAEYNMWFSDDFQQQELNSMNVVVRPKTGKVESATTRKRKKSLKRNRSLVESTELASRAHGLEDILEVPGFPVQDAQVYVKRRPGVVYSPQSDDHPEPSNFSCANDMVGNLDGLLNEVSMQPATEIFQEAPHGFAYQSEENIIRTPFVCYEEASTSHICDTFELQEVSCVPESCFVSGINSRTDYEQAASVHFADYVSSVPAQLGAGVGHLDDTIFSPNGDLKKPILGHAHDIYVESVLGNEDLDDALRACNGSIPIEYNFMDECSRAGFSMRPADMQGNIGSHEDHSVQQTWRKLHSRRLDLKSYLDPNHKDARSIADLSSRLTDLLSEADIMASCCRTLYNDILHPSETPCVEPASASWYDQQFEICSTFAQHGLCFYTSKSAVVGSNLSRENSGNVVLEMLACTSNTMAIGKLLEGRDAYNEQLQAMPRCSFSSATREPELELYGAIVPTVPARLSMALKGPAFHDYLSFMSKISKLDSSRSTDDMNGTRRRRSRTSRHYLSSGQLSLPPEDIQLLGQCFSFKDGVSQ